MAQERNRNTEDSPRDMNENRLEQRSSTPNDLPDSAEDARKMQNEETVIDLPDVKDIPGQEFVNTPSLDAIGDTTISSDDEEGTSVFDRDDSEDTRTGTASDVDNGERSALRQTDYMPTRDEDNLYRASLDHTDFQGEELNERSFGDDRSGRDASDSPEASTENPE